MRCTACAAELIPGKKFCHACGAPVGHACPSCSAPIDPGFQFCPDCGASLTAAAIATPRDLPGERKRVTVLFCDLAGSTEAAERLDPEEYRELLDRFLALSLAQVDRFEGTVNQLAGDGFMALFGAPIAHEDAPERALRAALAIQEALRGFALRPRIGVHTGMVVVGNVGSLVKTDYTAIGDTTNLASRLESLAEPGTILSSEATQRLVRGRFVMERRGPFDVKGKSEPVVAYLVLAFSDAPRETHALTPFVGRGQELAHLQAAFERVSSNLPQVVAVVGAAGSGKSRLVHEFRSWLAERPVELFTARCASLSRGVPYALWVDMMRRYLGIKAGEAPEPALEKLRARLAQVAGEEAEALLPGFRKILALPGSDPGANTFEAVDRLVCRASRETPVVMIVEDLHWIDDASREALELAISGFVAERCMMLVTHRPEFEAHWQSASVTQLQLRPLPDGDALEIVRALSGGALPPQLEARILRQGVGNPFFLEELTRGLLEDGTLVRRDGAVEVTRPVHEIRIPDSVQELLGARLDRLEPRAKRAAQVAAVLGRQFASDLLAKLLEEDAEEPIAELERRGIVRRTVGGELRFGESLTQEVAYQGLLLRERRSLHGRAARLLEEGGKAGKALVAHHWARSDERERGVELMLEAAREAETLPSYGDAIRLHQEAWDLAETVLAERPEDERLQRFVLRAVEGVCRVSVLYGSPEDTEEHRAAHRGEELAEALGETDSLANLYVLHGMILVGGSRERFEQGVELVEKALATGRKSGSDALLARYLRGLAWAYLLDGRFADSRSAIDESLAAFERLGEAEACSDAYMGSRFLKCQLVQQTDDLAEAERELEAAYALARRIGNRTIQTATGSMLARLHFCQGHYDEAERLAGQALAIGEEIGNLGTLRNCTAVLRAVACERGDRSVSALELERLERGLLKGGESTVNLDQIVDVLVELGRLESARRIAEGTVARSGANLLRAKGLLAFGSVCARLGANQWGPAQRALAEGVGIAGRLGVRSLEAKGMLGLAEVAAARGEPELAGAHAKVALESFRALGLGHFAKRAERLLASL